MMSVTKIFGIMTLVIALGACASTELRRPSMSMMYDVTRSSALLPKQDSLILVTMHNDDHRRLVKGGMRIGKDDVLPPRYAQFIANMSKRYNLSRVADWPLDSLGIRCLVFSAPTADSRAAIVSRLMTEPLVESAQSMQFFQTMADDENSAGSEKYNDPYLNMQHGFRDMQITASHSFATGKGVRIAVIDTGVDTRHADLQQQILETRNFIDRNSKQFRSDIHGTAIAGVIAAIANNDQGIVGVAPDASIVAIKACKQLEPGNSKATCDSFALAKSLDFALSENVDVINLSLAGPQDVLLKRLVQRAIERDILVVGAADPSRPGDFPAYIEGVVAVSEIIQSNGNAGGFVNAPGKQVISAFPGDRYEFYSGSSLATAQIAGISALIKQRKPHLPSSAVQDLLNTTAESATGTANGCRALARVISGATCP